MIKLDKDKTLILVALEDELPEALAQGWTVGYTGVGKVNAVIAAAKYAAHHKPEVIVNFGTAGSLNDDVHGFVEASRFYERDMDVRPLGFAIGQTPFEDEIEIANDRSGVSCGSGDSFVTQKPEIETDLVDMEAYALAKFCKEHGIKFYCFKYVSDKADGEAALSWQEQVSKGAHLFSEKVLKVN